MAVSGGHGIDEDAFGRLQATLGASFPEFLALFLTEGARHVERMERAVHADDLAAAGSAAHALRPTSGLVGAPGLQEACGRVEAACRTAAAAEVVAGVEDVRSAFEAASGWLRMRLPEEETP